MGNNVSAKLNTVYVIGKNTYGELGLKHKKDSKILTKLHSDHIDGYIVNIVSGHNFSIYITNNNTYWGAGCNKNGELGIEAYHSYLKELKMSKTSKLTQSPTIYTKCTKIMYFEDNDISIKKVMADVSISCTFWIGYKDNVYKKGITPHQKRFGLNNLENVSDMRCTEDFTVALCSNDIVSNKLLIEYWYTSGRSNIIIFPTDIINLIINYCEKPKNRGIYCTDGIQQSAESAFGDWYKIRFFDDKNIISISCGSRHCLYLDINGYLYSYGKNNYNQCGISYKSGFYDINLIKYFVNNKIYIKDVKCGYNHNLVIDYNFNIYSWGYGSYGQLGHGTSKHIKQPKLIESLKDYKIINIECGQHHSYAMSFDYQHFLWGTNTYNECLTFDGRIIVKSPFCINKTFKQNVGDYVIVSVSLGTDNTKLIVRKH